MRLVCPNCGAQYEVDDRVIPEGGRDVQCSNCAQTWFQEPAAQAADETAVVAEPDRGAPEPSKEEAPAGPDRSDAEPGVEPQAEAGSQPEPEGDQAAEPVLETHDEPEPQAASAPEADEAPSLGAPPRREMDDSIRSILQEERSREMAARASETAPGPETVPAAVSAPEPEPEPEPKLDPTPEPASNPAQDADAETSPEPAHGTSAPAAAIAALAGAVEATRPAPTAKAAERPTPAAALTDRPAAVAGETGGFALPPVDPAPQDKPTGKDLFPDVDEINSTLDSHSPEGAVAPVEPEAPRGGFGRGFFAVIFLAALALALYLAAPQLARSVPALEPALTGYVGLVNALRDWLDGVVRGMTASMTGEG